LPDLQACPRRPQLAAIQPPLQKDDSTLRLGVLCSSSCLRGQCPAPRCGKPWTPGPSRRGPAQAFSVDRSYVTPVLASVFICAGQLGRCALRLGPNVDAVAGRIQRKFSILPSRDALPGLSNRCTKEHPVPCGGCRPRTGRQRWGFRVQFKRTREPLVPESACGFHTGAVHGACGIRFSPRVAPGLQWTLNK